MREDFFPLENLLSFRKPEQVSAFLESNIEDLSLKWEDIGRDETNFPRLAISKSGVKSFVERITNSIDAVLENQKELKKRGEEINSPREALKELFYIKGKHIHFLSEFERRDLAKKGINVILDDSGIQKKPTVTIKDFGIGIHPDEFEDTVVGLGKSLKRGKKHLLGAYGWGGSQTFMWCNGVNESVNFESLPLAIIVSRKNPQLLKEGQRDEVGWTIVRYKENPDEKHGVFQYLVDKNNKTLRTTPINLPKDFDYGTCIIHLAYDLENFHGPMTLSSFRLFQSLLFDPILPFWLYDNRQKTGRTISGNLSRLSNDEKSIVEYSNVITQKMSFGEEVKIRYWVLKQKNEGGYHIDSYLSKQGSNESITITLNGQQYDSLTKKIVRDSGFAFLTDYLIFQIECDSLSYSMKKNIFPSTRENARDKYKDNFAYEIINILRTDEELKKIEDARKQDHLTSRDEKSISRIKKFLNKLISVNKKIIEGGGKGADKKKKEEYKYNDPPTFLKIIPQKETLELIPDEEKKIVLQTDASNDFLIRDKKPGSIIVSTGDIPCKIRYGFLKDGKLNVYLKINKYVPIKTAGLLTCTMKIPEEDDIVSKKSIEIISSPPPLPSNYPPTIFEISNTESPLMIKKGRRSLIQIECDGPDGLLENPENETKLDVSFLPDLGVKVIGKSDLINHKIKIFLKCEDNVEIGKRTEIICKLILEDGKNLISKRDCVISKPPEEEGNDKGGKIEVYDYELIQVEPESKFWNDFMWDEKDVGKYVKSGDSLILYVSLGNKHYLNTINSSEISPEKVGALKEKYTSYIGYHLWLSSENNLDMDEGKPELKRISQTVLLALSQDPRFR